MPEVWEVAAFGGSCIWWLMLLGDRGLSWCLGQRTDWNFSERLVLPHKMLIVESAGVLQRGLGGPQVRAAEDEGEALLQTRDMAFLLFLSPGSPGVYLWSNSAARRSHRPPLQLQGKGRRASSHGDRARSAEKSVWGGGSPVVVLGGPTRCCGALV